MAKSRDSDKSKNSKAVVKASSKSKPLPKRTPEELSKWAKEFSDNLNDWFRED